MLRSNGRETALYGPSSHVYQRHTVCSFFHQEEQAMVAILVLLTFIGFIALDMFLHRHSLEGAGRPAWAAGLRAVPIRANRFPAPAPGTFVTANHLTAILADNGILVLRPDAMMSEAAGPGGAFSPASGETRVIAGERLYEMRTHHHALPVASPWSGRVVTSNGDSILFAPDDLADAIRRMRIGETLKTWWEEERERLGLFLAGTSDLEGAMADGGELRAGFVDALSAEEAERFRCLFLDAIHR
jgi:hypothetical protein